MLSDSSGTLEYVAGLIEQMLASVKPPIIHEETRIMELTMQQFKTLVLLYTEGPMRMSNISNQLGIGMPAVTSLVSKLEEKGLVTREHNTDDRRVVLCCATEQGKSEVDRLWSVRREHINRIIGAMNEEEAKLVAQATQVIIKVLKNIQEGEPTGIQMAYSGEK